MIIGYTLLFYYSILNLLFVFCLFSYLVSGCIQFTLFGAGTVYLQLASQIFQDLMSDVLPKTGICIWFIFIAVLLTVPMWLGSPKDFW